MSLQLIIRRIDNYGMQILKSVFSIVGMLKVVMFKHLSKLIGIILLLIIGLLWVPHVSANNHENGKETWKGGGIAPSAGAPLCPTHDPTAWHGIWDPERGCHYDHEHKDNPGILYEGIPYQERIKAERLIDVFGAPGEWFGGASISYPWQTFMGASASYPPPNEHTEQAHKHAGYGWVSEAWLPRTDSIWLKDYRIQYHAIFAAMGATTRYHSFTLEANICQDRRGCYVVRTGGWLDFGHLVVANEVVELPGQSGDGVRRRMHQSYNPWFDTDVELFGSPAFWYGQLGHPDQLGANWQWGGRQNPFDRLVMILETEDTWAYIDPSNPKEDYFHCPQFNCNKNGSTIKLHRLDMYNRGDMLGFKGFTDRYGLVNESCTETGLDCIPTEIGTPFQFWQESADNRPMREFDYSPPGVYWIKYPN